MECGIIELSLSEIRAVGKLVNWKHTQIQDLEDDSSDQLLTSDSVAC